MGIDFWFTRNLAFEAFYLRAGDPGTAGGGSGYTFTSSLAANVAGVTGKIGFPLGKFRFYGQGGGTYTWATLTTDETIASATQTLTLKTKGLGFTISGGTEYWWKPRLALYAEVGRAGLGGSAVGGGEGGLDDAVLYSVAGLRFRLTGSR